MTSETNDNRPLLIRASAGTGKTYQLTGRLLRLLVQGTAIETVLATTFTRKAAGEILNRVLVVLAATANDQSGKLLADLRNQIGVPELTSDDCVALVHRLLRDVHRLKILTLDSLFSQLARTFGYELGMPPGWRLTDEIEDAWIRERAIDVMLGSLSTAEVSSLLSMLGKGDSKRSVRREMLNVVNDGYAEARACQLQAWQTLIVPTAPQSVELEDAAERLRSTTMGHKSAEKTLVKIADLVIQNAWDDLAKNTLVKNVKIAGSGEPITYYNKQVPTSAVLAIDLIAQRCTTHVLSLLKSQTEATGKIIGTYESQLMAMKRALRAFAFDDVAHRLSGVFSAIDSDGAGHRMDGNIRHVLLDEFQDTSPSQWAVLKPISLAAVELETDSGDGSFFCVGDTKQAIYGWRGGVAGIFDAVAEQVPGVRQREQNISFRSSPVITSTVNQIFDNLTRHPEWGGGPDPGEASHDRAAYDSYAIRMFSQHFPEHKSAKESLPGHVVFASSPAVAAEQPSGDEKGSGAKETAQTRTARHFQFVAQRISELAADMPGRSIGVLTRRNVSVAWMIYLLRARGVDVSQEGGNPLTDSPAVDLVLSAFMMAEHPVDRRWWFHVATSPLADWLQTDPKDKSNRAASRMRRLIEDEGVAGAVVAIADRIAPVCDASDVLRLRQLVTLAQQYELNRQPRASDFVQLVRTKRVEKPQPAQVRVMTVHQSKGLEFDVVVLPELAGAMTRQSRQTIAMKKSVESIPDAMLRYVGTDYWHYLPLDWQQTFGGHAAGLMTESLCLLYVAITRARHALHMLVPPAEKPEFKNKTAAAMVYHALGCDADPTIGNHTWYQSGDPNWHSR